MDETTPPNPLPAPSAVGDLMADILVRASPQCVILYVSPACAGLGYSPEELVGWSAEALVHPDDWARFWANGQRALSGAPSDRPVDREFRCRMKNGGWIWLEGNPQILRDQDGTPIEFVNVFRDVTARRRAREGREEQARFEQRVIEMAGVGYWRYDARIKALTWSSEMFRTYGVDPSVQPSMELALSMGHPDDNHAARERVRHALESGEGWDGQAVRVVRPDGEVRYIDTRGVAERDRFGAVSVIFGAIVDITERRRAELAASQAEASRRNTVELFENAFHHAPIGMALVGLDGRFIKINAAFCNLVGYPEDRMLDLDFQAITHPDDLNLDLSLLEELVAGKIPYYRMEKRYLRADGALVWVNLAVSMVVDEDGRPKHFISQVQDLTARKKAETDYRMMAENITDMIATTRLDGRAAFISASCRDIAGYEPEDLVGRRTIEFVHPDDVRTLLHAFSEVAAGRGGDPVRWRVKHKLEDRWVWVESNPGRFWPDGPDGDWLYLDAVRNVTAQVAQEEALDKALVAAEAASAAKSEFLANMSHEIRTPLTAILGFSTLLNARPNLDEVARGHLQKVTTASKALLSLVNDVLDFSKLEAGQFEITPRPADPAGFAREALLMFSPQADAKGLALDFVADGEIPSWLAFDPDRLRQVLINLIGNAIKFTVQGGVTLRARYDPGKQRLHLEIQDTGPGLSRADQAKLFQRFAQVDGASTRKHGGTGLGLAICKGLTEAMGGQIGLRSKRGQGSTFHLYIVAPSVAAPEQAEEAEADAPMLDGVRVLVVDDNPMNRELARTVLEMVGAAVSEAVDGEDCLRCVRDASFDVILLDYRMPGIDGPETLRRLRARPGPNARAPVLAFTADSELASFQAGHDFDGVIAKPIDALALISTVAEWTTDRPDTQALAHAV